MTREIFGLAYLQGFKRTVLFLRSRGASMDIAEDVAQSAWLQGWQKLDQLRDERMIVSWVNTIALNYHRRRSQRDARYQALPEVPGHFGVDSAPLDATRILDLCSPRDRMLFQQQLGGVTMGEIAEEEGVSVTAIRIRYWRARRAVRACAEARASERLESYRTLECAAVSG